MAQIKQMKQGHHWKENGGFGSNIFYELYGVAQWVILLRKRLKYRIW
jgi:hypothetical protein